MYNTNKLTGCFPCFETKSIVGISSNALKILAAEVFPFFMSVKEIATLPNITPVICITRNTLNIHVLENVCYILYIEHNNSKL